MITRPLSFITGFDEVHQVPESRARVRMLRAPYPLTSQQFNPLRSLTARIWSPFDCGAQIRPGWRTSTVSGHGSVMQDFLEFP